MLSTVRMSARGRIPAHAEPDGVTAWRRLLAGEEGPGPRFLYAQAWRSDGWHNGNGRRTSVMVVTCVTTAMLVWNGQIAVTVPRIAIRRGGRW